MCKSCFYFILCFYDVGTILLDALCYAVFLSVYICLFCLFICYFFTNKHDMNKHVHKHSLLPIAYCKKLSFIGSFADYTICALYFYYILLMVLILLCLVYCVKYFFDDHLLASDLFKLQYLSVHLTAHDSY